MTSEELLNIHKIIREKKDYHRSCFDSLLRRVIDIRRVLEAHPEGNNKIHRQTSERQTSENLNLRTTNVGII